MGGFMTAGVENDFTATTVLEFWRQHLRQMPISFKYSIFVRWHDQITNQAQSQNVYDRKDSEEKNFRLQIHKNNTNISISPNYLWRKKYKNM